MAGRPGEEKRWWNPDNLRDVAESLGIANLSNEATGALQAEVEYRVHMVIQEAKRFMHAGKRTVLQTTDISQALKVLEVEPLYGYESTRPLRFGEASLGPGQPLFYIEDEEVDFERLINAPLPPVPRDMSFTAHWLAIEGVQPSIPQNPTTVEARALELYPKGNHTLAAAAGHETPGMKPLTKHVLSKEQHKFFDSIIEEIANEEQGEEVEAKRQAAFACVRESAGIQQLLSYFISFIAEKVTHNNTSLFICNVVIDLIKAILENERFFLEPYINSFIPPIGGCAFGDRPISEIGEHNIQADYELRRVAGQLIGHICNKYDKDPERNLTVRAATTCLEAFTKQYEKPLAVHYGAIVAYTSLLPPDGIRKVFAPALNKYEKVLEKGRKEGMHDDLKMVIGAIMDGLDKLAKNPPPMMMNEAATDNDIDMEERRERLVAIVGETIADKILSLEDDTLERALTWDPKKTLGF